MVNLLVTEYGVLVQQTGRTRTSALTLSKESKSRMQTLLRKDQQLKRLVVRLKLFACCVRSWVWTGLCEAAAWGDRRSLYQSESKDHAVT